MKNGALSKTQSIIDVHDKARVVVRFVGDGLLELWGDGIHFASLTDRLGKHEWFSIPTTVTPSLALDERRLELVYLVVLALNRMSGEDVHRIKEKGQCRPSDIIGF